MVGKCRQRAADNVRIEVEDAVNGLAGSDRHYGRQQTFIFGFDDAVALAGPSL